MIKYYIISILFFLKINCFAQNVYPTKFSGCITDHFALESDSITGKVDINQLIKTILSGLDEKTKSKIEGVLSLQIIINLDGSSCLISINNETNIKSSKLHLKENIDNNLKWEVPYKKVSPLIQLKFNPKSIQYRRLGINGNKGNHIIEEKEILKESLN
jgi:hypothetical protein